MRLPLKLSSYDGEIASFAGNFTVIDNNSGDVAHSNVLSLMHMGRVAGWHGSMVKSMLSAAVGLTVRDGRYGCACET